MNQATRKEIIKSLVRDFADMSETAFTEMVADMLHPARVNAATALECKTDVTAIVAAVKRNTPRPMGQIKKELQPEDCSNVKTLLKMFRKIAADNPDAIKAAFGPFTTGRMNDKPETGDQMVSFYNDMAEYLIDLFDYR